MTTNLGVWKAEDCASVSVSPGRQERGKPRRNPRRNSLCARLCIRHFDLKAP